MPPPTPQVLQVSMTPATRTYQPALRLCGETIPALRLAVEEIPASRLDFNSGLSIRLGTPNIPAPFFAAQIGVDQIVVVLHPDNPVAELSSDDLRLIFTGQVTTWDEFDPSYPEPIQVWSYPESDELQQLFSAALWQTNAPKILAYLAPDPSAMIEAVSDSPGAIGYLPSSWVIEGSMNLVALNDVLRESLRQPVILFSAQEPQDLARALVSCLQSPLP